MPKKGMNSFFKIMLDAKKKKLPSFVYTDKSGKSTTYYGHAHPMLGMVYKKSKSPLKPNPKMKTRKKSKSSKASKGKSRRRRRKSKSKRKSKSRRKSKRKRR
tara:strand:+ start:159 stop:464 length:306 start_codon:yes stop_codon:yes gene_type:complete